VVRTALVYGASAWYSPAVDGKAKGIAKSLVTAQSTLLRVIAGAYKATPVRQLEREVDTLPLDLYLSGRVVAFEARLQASGMDQLVKNSAAKVANWLKRRGPRPKKPIGDVEVGSQGNRAIWARDWFAGGSPVEAIDREWRVRWDLTGGYYRRPPEPVDDPRFGEDPLDKHIGLLKYESSIFI